MAFDELTERRGDGNGMDVSRQEFGEGLLTSKQDLKGLLRTGRIVFFSALVNQAGSVLGNRAGGGCHPKKK